MKKLTKSRKLILIISALLTGIVGGTCILFNQPKKAYDYDNYLVPKANSEAQKETSEDELPEMMLSLELLQSK